MNTVAHRRAGGNSKISLVSVYEDRICRGFIISRGKLGFEAFGCDERSLGIFPSQREAANALLLVKEDV
jgi:hypothetical protein